MTRIQRQRPTRQRSTGCFCAALSEAGVCLFGSALFLLFAVLMLETSEDIVFDHQSSSLLRLRTNETSEASAALLLRHRQGALSCSDVKAKVASGQWSDPNQGRIYARETITHPHFRISLHNEEYDNVRWNTIMEKGKYYETDVHARFVHILKGTPRSYVLDVGANIGYYTLLSAALGHDVISFEPNPANILRLCDSLRLNDWNTNISTSTRSRQQPHVFIFQNAIADTNGEMKLFVPKNPGAATLKGLDVHIDADRDHQAITKVLTLDTFAEERGWFDENNKEPSDDDFCIALLKIDVEGKDPHVVLGATRLLKSGLVKNVLTEGRRFGRPNVLDSFVTLFEAGFTLKDPIVPLKGTTPEEHARSVVDYYQETFGKNSMRTTDMWWIKE